MVYYSAMVTKKPIGKTRTTKPVRKTKRLKPLGQMIADLVKDISDEEMAKFPRDGAANHDHYIYGTPKQYGRTSSRASVTIARCERHAD